VAREGIPFVIVPAILALLFALVGLWPVTMVLVLLTAFMAYFFRDPERVVPTDAGIVVAPADGKVTRVAVLDSNDERSSQVISIFLSPLDVHINRSPIAGEVLSVTYTRGKFLMATSPQASLVNEQNSLTIRGEHITVVCKQIAGILARRIVCWKKPNDSLRLGERFGLIKFSSRTDVILPHNVEVLVTEGTRVKGGVTIIGRLRD
jgi:phosphatidylserine decarboxylase